MRRLKAYLLVLAAVLLAACDGIEYVHKGPYEKVLIYCGLGYNNLSSNLLTNFADIQEGVLPSLASDRAIVAFCHNTASSGDYTTANPPQLIRLLRGSDGKPVADTLKTYSDITLSSTADALRRALLDIQEMFPSRSYGMLFSSHGTGWIPGGYQSGTEASSIRQFSRHLEPIYTHSGLPYSHSGLDPESHTDSPVWPETKAVGNQYVGNMKNIRWLEFGDFVNAIPMQLDYLILDACLMGTVEVAWELKDVCRYVVASPTEILTDGMIYKTLSWDMLNGTEADLRTYCEEFFDYYNAETGSRRAGTITLVDCAKLDAVAQALAPIVAAHRDAITSCLSRTQRYYYSSSPLRFYYDLRDFAAQLVNAGGTASTAQVDAALASLDAALAAAIPYHAETPAFFDLPLERCCGLSVYIPDPLRVKLNAAYSSLGWTRAVHLVE